MGTAASYDSLIEGGASLKRDFLVIGVNKSEFTKGLKTLSCWVSLILSIMVFLSSKINLNSSKLI